MTSAELTDLQAIPQPAPTADPAAPAIAVRRASKLYSRHDGRAESLKANLLQALVKRGSTDVIVALDNVDLVVAPGESIGLIGANGSGKSTLLKLIAGISQPTSGTVETNGQVLGLIELGAGFHPDLTGEENVHLQGSIYGLEARQVESMMESILEFAELKDFRHLPVKHYSSGMFVRLGFAIAIHVRPRILLVDEVMSVGDQSFQERCMREIKRLRAAGTTLVFVTHYPEQTERICDRVAWLDQGHLRQVGPASRVLAAYHAELINRRFSASEGRLTVETTLVGLPGRFGSGEAHIKAVRILNSRGEPCTYFQRGEPFAIELDYTAQPGIEAVDCTIPLDSIDGTILTLWRAEREGEISRPIDGRGTFRLAIDQPNLLPGRYRMTISISPPGLPSNHYDVLYRIFHFTVEPDPQWETIAPIELKPRAEVLAED